MIYIILCLDRTKNYYQIYWTDNLHLTNLLQILFLILLKSCIYNLIWKALFNLYIYSLYLNLVTIILYYIFSN